MWDTESNWRILGAASVAIIVCLFVFVIFIADIFPEMKCVKSLIAMAVDIFRSISKFNGSKKFSYADVFESKVDTNPNFIQIISVEDEKCYSLAYIEEIANRIANWGKPKGLKQKSTVALMLLNRPEYLSFWIGMAKVGCSTALLNTNLSGSSLLHSVKVALETSPVKLLVIDDDIEGGIANDLAALRQSGVTVVSWSALLVEAASCSPSRPSPAERSTVCDGDTLLMIYTSGTTGMPKASKITQRRALSACFPYYHMCRLRPQLDRVYCVLPFYHSAAGLLGLGACLHRSITIVMRRKFSARKFSEDCYKFKCTSTQYIGELCRYLCQSPPSEFDSLMCLESAFGNGLRPEVWLTFQKRYNIKNIVEFYGSTEGNVTLFNSTGKVGSVGYFPRILDFMYPVLLVKMDPDDSGEPIRGPDGCCIPCKVGEPGLVLGFIDNHRRFEGYTDTTATKKKLLRDVIRKGDTFFSTGDMMSRDADGYFYWEDRVGDTFRWKGENVSTTEITKVIATATDSISDVAVYGVSVNGYDGKVGMAAVMLREGVESLDLDGLLSAYNRDLPAYARPVFIRVTKAIPLTVTFKHKKNVLADEGFDVNKYDDKVYMYRNGKFEQLTRNLLQEIVSLSVRL